MLKLSITHLLKERWKRSLSAVPNTKTICATLKSISGIQEQQSHCGCSITYFSRVCYLPFVDLWLRGASVRKCARCGARLHSCCCGVVVDNEPLRGNFRNPHKSYMWSQRVTQWARSYVQPPHRGHRGGENRTIKLRIKSTSKVLILGVFPRRVLQQSMMNHCRVKGETFCPLFQHQGNAEASACTRIKPIN